MENAALLPVTPNQKHQNQPTINLTGKSGQTARFIISDKQKQWIQPYSLFHLYEYYTE
ncbi:hypothetical protein XBI1_2040089 [Xenorhabdus bovienii str. Intermedium]|uniref:Uncharacterized protein n=1 Tax=Xenorhabdus bovienii str. Intermedium TaxID=1379677 RepID=A0A077QHN1_XENBV|nr:hypothetical protein XBI1_2040089 [Xenorhabdus bovienii str. Intermedium]